MAEPPNYVPWEPETVAVAKQNAENRRREEIARIAYFKWVDAGSPPGDGHQFWLAAESEYDNRKFLGKMVEIEEINRTLRTEEKKPEKKEKPQADKGADIRPLLPLPEIRGDEKLPWMERVRRFWGRLIP